MVKRGRDVARAVRKVLATTIQMSSRKFMLNENNFKYEMSKQVVVTDINDLDKNKRENVVAKVINVSSPKEITKD